MRSAIRAQADELVAELGCERGAFLRGERLRLPAQRLRLVGPERLLDQLLGPAAAGLARQVHLLGSERPLEAQADGLRRLQRQLRHGNATSTSTSCLGSW
jgi:hypothetical protein